MNVECSNPVPPGRSVRSSPAIFLGLPGIEVVDWRVPAQALQQLRRRRGPCDGMGGGFGHRKRQIAITNQHAQGGNIPIVAVSGTGRDYLTNANSLLFE